MTWAKHAAAAIMNDEEGESLTDQLKRLLLVGGSIAAGAGLIWLSTSDTAQPARVRVAEAFGIKPTKEGVSALVGDRSALLTGLAVGGTGAGVGAAGSLPVSVAKYWEAAREADDANRVARETAKLQADEKNKKWHSDIEAAEGKRDKALGRLVDEFEQKNPRGAGRIPTSTEGRAAWARETLDPANLSRRVKNTPLGSRLQVESTTIDPATGNPRKLQLFDVGGSKNISNLQKLLQESEEAGKRLAYLKATGYSTPKFVAPKATPKFKFMGRATKAGLIGGLGSGLLSGLGVAGYNAVAGGSGLGGEDIPDELISQADVGD